MALIPPPLLVISFSDDSVIEDTHLFSFAEVDRFISWYKRNDKAVQYKPEQDYGDVKWNS